MSLKAISYNLLHPDYARTHPAACLSDGGKTWATRRTQAEANISGADIVCLQECDKSMVESIKGPKQAFFAAHKGKPDGVGILVDSSRFTVLDIKTEYDIPTGHATLFIDLFDKRIFGLHDFVAKVMSLDTGQCERMLFLFFRRNGFIVREQG